jgi:hypothetical protein
MARGKEAGKMLCNILEAVVAPIKGVTLLTTRRINHYNKHETQQHCSYKNFQWNYQFKKI